MAGRARTLMVLLKPQCPHRAAGSHVKINHDVPARAALTVQRGRDRMHMVPPRTNAARSSRPKPCQANVPLTTGPSASCPWPLTPAKDGMWARRLGKPSRAVGPGASCTHGKLPRPVAQRMHQLRGRKLKGKAPLRSSANHTLFCSNSSEKVEKSTMLEGPVPRTGRAQVRIPALWTPSRHSPCVAPVLSSVKWVRLQ